MEKNIKQISINGNEIRFKAAILHVGRNDGITYILSVSDPVGLPRQFQNAEIDIITTENEERTIMGTLDFVSKDRARIYVSGEPFPVTENERRKYY